MKYQIFYLLLITTFLYSCLERENRESMELSQTNNTDTTILIEKEVDFKPFTYAITDSTDDVFVNLTHTDGKGTYLITWGDSSYRDSADLNSMTEDRGYRLPPSFLYANESFICIKTNWTGPFSEHLFLPLNRDLKFKFFKEDIEWMDSVKNQICYIHIDKTESLKTYWTYENLLSGYKKDFEIPVYERSISYPWYSDILRKGKYLEIEPQGDYNQKFKIEIK